MGKNKEKFNYFETKTGLWRITKSDIGLLIGNVLLVGPEYRLYLGELRPRFMYYLLSLEDSISYINFYKKVVA